ncbi:hypothetical protein [Wielerella bovis]|nr:hypothetical protein [Wielerella bovis]MCG7656055.1 hypothetical protein [Wielerella bovis]MCG7658281.1 hypothetical protein [Wielerella bovis]
MILEPVFHNIELVLSPLHATTVLVFHANSPDIGMKNRLAFARMDNIVN